MEPLQTTNSKESRLASETQKPQKTVERHTKFKKNKNKKQTHNMSHNCLLHSDIQRYKHELDYTEMSDMCCTHSEIHNLCRKERVNINQEFWLMYGNVRMPQCE